MSDTRRTFLQSAALGAGLSGLASAARNQPAREPLLPVPEVQVPKMKFFDIEVSRMVMGVNPFYGFSHFNNIYSQMMRDYYTPEKVCEVLHQANRYGINALNYVHLGRAPQDLARFQAEGGKMHLIVQGIGDPAPIVKAVRPRAMYCQGEQTDKAYQDGDMDSIKDWCKKARDLGVIVGVGTHKPEVLAQVESEGWDVDFYAGCVYNRTRTPDEWKKTLNGELLEMPGETYLQSDPGRMYSFMRQTRKPCFAFKIMAAGRIGERGADQAFQTAFAGIKPNDGVFVGMFPRIRDEVRENAERVHRLLVRT